MFTLVDYPRVLGSKLEKVALGVLRWEIGMIYAGRKLDACTKWRSRKAPTSWTVLATTILPHFILSLTMTTTPCYFHARSKPDVSRDNGRLAICNIASRASEHNLQICVYTFNAIQAPRRVDEEQSSLPHSGYPATTSNGFAFDL